MITEIWPVILYKHSSYCCKPFINFHCSENIDCDNFLSHRVLIAFKEQGIFVCPYFAIPTDITLKYFYYELIHQI